MVMMVMAIINNKNNNNDNNNDNKPVKLGLIENKLVEASILLQFNSVNCSLRAHLHLPAPPEPVVGGLAPMVARGAVVVVVVVKAGEPLSEDVLRTP